MRVRFPWLDRSGRFSALKATTLALLMTPGLVTATRYLANDLGARPLNEAIHATGLWAVRLLLLSLFVSPIRHILRLPKLVVLRRMIGVAAFAYAAGHLTLYAADQAFDLGKAGAEIVLRLYLTIGFAAFLLLAVLAITSTDGMIRRLGGKGWQALHRAAYAASLLAIIHYFMQSKLDVAEATVVAGCGLWLIAYRLVAWTAGTGAAASIAIIALLGTIAAALTALGEAAYFHFLTAAAMSRVLRADLSLATGWRPGQVVMLAGFAVVAVALARRRRSRPASPPSRPPALDRSVAWRG
jgi:sulfoxide reductase heme-binding subunit YedZ